MRCVFWLFFLILGTALAEEPLPPGFDDMAQDGGGTVWAFDTTRKSQLFIFDGKAWVATPVPFAGGGTGTPESVDRMPDGAVVCVWQMEGGKVAVTRHLGTSSKLLAEFAGDVSGDGVAVAAYGDSKKWVWIAGTSAAIHRVDAAGNLFAYEIKPGQFLNGDPSDPPGSASYNPIRVAEDGHGRAWAWSDSHLGESSNDSLRGVLVFDGDKATPHQITGIQGQHISTILRKDEKYMWVGVINDGLYLVDIDTFVAKRAQGAELGWVDRMFYAGGDLFALASREGNFDSDLWRLHDGQWAMVIAKTGYPSMKHGWLSEEKSLILCAQRATWLIRDGAAPVPLDAKNGFSLAGTRRIFRLKDGSVVALGNSGERFHEKITLPQ